MIIIDKYSSHVLGILSYMIIKWDIQVQRGYEGTFLTMMGYLGMKLSTTNIEGY